MRFSEYLQEQINIKMDKSSESYDNIGMYMFDVNSTKLTSNDTKQLDRYNLLNIPFEIKPAKFIKTVEIPGKDQKNRKIYDLYFGDINGLLKQQGFYDMKASTDKPVVFPPGIRGNPTKEAKYLKNKDKFSKRKKITKITKIDPEYPKTDVIIKLDGKIDSYLIFKHQNKIFRIMSNKSKFENIINQSQKTSVKKSRHGSTDSRELSCLWVFEAYHNNKPYSHAAINEKTSKTSVTGEISDYFYNGAILSLEAFKKLRLKGSYSFERSVGYNNDNLTQLFDIVKSFGSTVSLWNPADIWLFSNKSKKILEDLRNSKTFENFNNMFDEHVDLKNIVPISLKIPKTKVKLTYHDRNNPPPYYNDARENKLKQVSVEIRKDYIYDMVLETNDGKWVWIEKNSKNLNWSVAAGYDSENHPTRYSGVVSDENWRSSIRNINQNKMPLYRKHQIPGVSAPMPEPVSEEMFDYYIKIFAEHKIINKYKYEEFTTTGIDNVIVFGSILEFYTKYWKEAFEATFLISARKTGRKRSVGKSNHYAISQA